MTENGELYNVDGNSNRVAAICFGPKSVVVVAGVNKLVPDIAAALDRVRRMAAPANAIRRERTTYCAEMGECLACSKPGASGCTSEGRIYCSFVVHAFQRERDRIKVILVGEPLGF